MTSSRTLLDNGNLFGDGIGDGNGNMNGYGMQYGLVSYGHVSGNGYGHYGGRVHGCGGTWFGPSGSMVLLSGGFIHALEAL